MFDSAGREIEIHRRFGFTATGPRYRIARKMPEHPIEQTLAIGFTAVHPAPDDEEDEDE